MGCKPEMAVFRKFRTLNALRLLEMQSDLVQQEEDYEFLRSLDAQTNCPITQSYSKDWEALGASLGDGRSLQREAWRKLRDGLETYSTGDQAPTLITKKAY